MGPDADAPLDACGAAAPAPVSPSEPGSSGEAARMAPVARVGGGGSDSVGAPAWPRSCGGGAEYDAATCGGGGGGPDGGSDTSAPRGEGSAGESLASLDSIACGGDAASASSPPPRDAAGLAAGSSRASELVAAVSCTDWPLAVACERRGASSSPAPFMRGDAAGRCGGAGAPTASAIFSCASSAVREACWSEL